MPSRLIDNIGLLVTNDPAVGALTAERSHAAVVLDDDRIAWVGEAGDAPSADERIDADGACVIPGFRNERQVGASLNADGKTLSPQDMDFIRQTLRPA